MPDAPDKEGKRIVLLLSAFNFMLWAALGMLAPIEVLFLDTLTKSTSVKGIILAIPSIVILLFSPYVMKISDKYGKKKMMLFLILTSSAFFALLPFSPTYEIYGLVKAVSSLLFLTTPIAFAYVSGTVKRLGFGYGTIILASSLGGSAGSLLSGFAGQMFGLQMPFFIVTALALVSATIIMQLREMKVHIVGEPEIPKKTMKGKQYLLLAAVLVNSLVFSMHMSARGVLWPLALAGITDAPAMLTGIVFSLMGLAATIMSLPSGIISDKFGERKVFFTGWIVMGAAGVVIFFATGNLYLFIGLSILYALGEVLRGPASSAIIAGFKRPEYFGYASSIGALGGIAGPMVAGMVADVYGLNAAVLVMGMAVMLAVLPFMAIRGQKRRHKPDENTGVY